MVPSARLFRLGLALTLLLLMLTPVAASADADQDERNQRIQDHFYTYLDVMASRDRAPGSVGLDETAAFISRELSAAGLDASLHEYPALAPHYAEHALELNDGSRLPVHPLVPNGPVLASPGPEGITGPVRWAGDGSLEAMSGQSWHDAIAVLEARADSQWLTPFAFGAKAVLLLPRADGGAALAPSQAPYLSIPAQLPRFVVSPQAGDQLRERLAAGTGRVVDRPVTGVITGLGAWREAALPHVTAVVGGQDPSLAGDVIIVHADMDRSEYVGGPVDAASEATSAAYLLALAQDLADDPPARTVVLSFGSGRSRAFASLRHWLAEAELPGTISHFISIDLGDGGSKTAVSGARDALGQLAGMAGIETIDDSSEPGPAREELLGHNTFFAADAARWQRIQSTALTTVGRRSHLGGLHDLSGQLDATVLNMRLSASTAFIYAALDSLRGASAQATGRFTACLEGPGDGADAGEAGATWWVAGIDVDTVEDRDLRVLPLVQPAENGCVEFVGLSTLRFGFSLQVHAYIIDADGRVSAGRLQRSTIWEEPDPGSTQQAANGSYRAFQDSLAPGRVVTFTGWPAAAIAPVWTPDAPLSIGFTRELDRRALSMRTTGGWDGTVRDVNTGRLVHEALLEQIGPVATLMAPPRRDLLIQRPAMEVAADLAGHPSVVRDPPLRLELSLDEDLPPRVHGRLAAVEYLATASGGLLTRLRDSGGRHTYLEGLHATAIRELAAARDDLERGNPAAFDARLLEAHRALTEAHHGLLTVERDALISLVVYLLLAMIAAAALGPFLAVGRPPRERAVLAVIVFAVLYGAVRSFHPGYGMVDVAPEAATAGVLLAAAVAVGLVHLARKLELKAARGRQRRGHRPDIDRYSLMLAAVSVGLSQLGRRRLRSILTCASLTLFVFAFLAVAALTPSFELQRQQLGSDPAYQGVLVRAHDHLPLAARTPQDLERLLPYVDTLLPIRWQLTPRLEPPGGEWPEERGEPPVAWPLHVLESPEGRAVFRAVTTAPLAYGRLLGLDEALVAGQWPAAGPAQVVLPLAAARELGSEPQALVGSRLSMFYEFPAADGDTWRMDVAHPRQVEVVGVVDDAVWNRQVGLDGLPLAPPGIATARQLLVSPHIAAEFAAPVVAWAGTTDLAPPERDLRQLVTELPYAVYAGAGQARFAMGTAAPTLMRLAGPVGVLAGIGLLMVANTMLGAVYERKEEFRILNVIGLAPNHIRTLLLTEGAMLGVVAVVLGWTLVVLAGGIVQAAGLQAELALNLNSALLVVFLLVMIAVTAAAAAIPAQLAARGLAPGGREAMIPAAGDTFKVDLPFSVSAADVPALWAFLWPFLAPGTSDAASFVPYTIHWEADTDAVWEDSLRCEVLLHPTDTGVNQEIRLDAVPVRDTVVEDGCRIRVVLKRRSGDEDVWRRLNVALLSELRRQLLAWDLVAAAEREGYRRDASDLRGQAAVRTEAL